MGNQNSYIEEEQPIQWIINFIIFYFDEVFFGLASYILLRIVFIYVCTGAILVIVVIHFCTGAILVIVIIYFSTGAILVIVNTLMSRNTYICD
jgi:VIT1/CCC1 family predicted Fe2+/Mn2+ transporter